MALVSFGRLIRGRLFPPSDPIQSLEGKTVLITGGTSGLGFEAAKKYISLGVASLIIGCRNAERGSEVKKLLEERSRQHIKQRTLGNDSGSDDIARIHIWPLDMSSYDSVKSFAERVDSQVSRLDIALLNAGTFRKTYTRSMEGWESTVQVNALSTALLGLLLLPKLRQSRDAVTGNPAVLTLISSGSFRLAKAEELQPKNTDIGDSNSETSILQHLNDEQQFRAAAQYRLSKVLVEYAAKGIADSTRQEDGTIEVIVNSACPGFCRSGLGREFNAFYQRWFMAVFELFFSRKTEQGSRTLVTATLLGEESHGKWWRDDGYPDISYTLTGTEIGKRLQKQAWKEIVEELKHRYPEVGQLI
ncbi:hypothetical protein FQN57_004743 [Myotisia sp. PD_48]|nr:hypothetical protein FQN57_004743 [Myotisia sp. PD_48]